MSGVAQMLQNSLAAAQKDLSTTNDTIKKVTGRDPDALPPRPGPNRRTSAGGRLRAWLGDHDSPAAKRRDVFGSRSRLAGRLGPRPNLDRRRDSDGEEISEAVDGKFVLQSSVVATTAPPRPKADPTVDDKSKKRNRRMFGFLMGTLQKFKENEDAAKSSDKERRRSEIVEKLARAEEVEKEEAVKQRRDLYIQRRSQRTKVARLVNQMATVEMYEEWNNHDRRLCSFIRTKAKPPISYLPAHHTPETKKLLEATKEMIEEVIDKRTKEVEVFLSEQENKDSAGQEEQFMEAKEEEGREGEGNGEGGREGGMGRGRKRSVGSEHGEVFYSD